MENLWFFFSSAVSIFHSFPFYSINPVFFDVLGIVCWWRLNDLMYYFTYTLFFKLKTYFNFFPFVSPQNIYFLCVCCSLIIFMCYAVWKYSSIFLLCFSSSRRPTSQPAFDSFQNVHVRCLDDTKRENILHRQLYPP